MGKYKTQNVICMLVELLSLSVSIPFSLMYVIGAQTNQQELEGLFRIRSVRGISSSAKFGHGHATRATVLCT